MAKLLKLDFDTPKEEIAEELKECENKGENLNDVFVVKKGDKIMTALKRDLVTIISGKQFKDENPDLF